MPSARVIRAMKVKPGDFRSCRRAKRRSFIGLARETWPSEGRASARPTLKCRTRLSRKNGTCRSPSLREILFSSCGYFCSSRLDRDAAGPGTQHQRLPAAIDFPFHRMIMVRDLLGWKMRRNCLSFRLNLALAKLIERLPENPLCMGYATHHIVSFHPQRERFT